jgi:hypothetical protein
MTVMDFIPSEQFWLEQRVDQVNEQSSGHERRERVIENHDLISLKLLAGVDIRNRHGEEAERERHHHDVHHRNAPSVILKLPADAQWGDAALICVNRVQKVPAHSRPISALACIGIREGMDQNRIGIP